MTHQNLVLSEKAIKNHCKRLQKQISCYNKEFTLGQAQNLFAKTLGFNNFYELKEVLKNKPLANINTIEDFYNFIKKIEHQSDCVYINSEGAIKYKPHTTQNNDFILTEQYELNMYDWQNIIHLLLNKNDIQRLENEKDDKLVLNIRSNINHNLKRNIIAQFIKQDNKISHIKLMITYYSNDRFTKSYREIYHLF